MSVFGKAGPDKPTAGVASVDFLWGGYTRSDVMPVAPFPALVPPQHHWAMILATGGGTSPSGRDSGEPT